MKKKLDEMAFNSDIARFVFVGGCSTTIDFIVYFLLSFILPIIFSKAISMVFASVFSYVMNKNFTFKVKAKTNALVIVKFYIVFVTNLVFNVFTNYLVYGYVGSKIIAFICATIVGMTVNYLGQKMVVFK